MDVRPYGAAVSGFRFAGVSAGLRASGTAPDLGLIVADGPVAAAGAFTINRVKAAPVVVASERLSRGRLRAVAVNAGSANCFTGRAGTRLALECSGAVARELSCPPELVVPCSTGVIGHLYDLEKYRAGVRAAVAALCAEGLPDFARAIMTTDTRPKLASIHLRLGGLEVTVAGAVKGAGMISPGMATMLGFIVTDAAASAATLKAALRRAMPESFNAITVDGDMSTNDTVILMASGAAGNKAPAGRDGGALGEAVAAVAASLARQIVYDGEGATKLVEIEVRGARSRADAERAARRIANSPLVKTAFFGCDPNVGRILAAAGASGASLDPERLELRIDGVRVGARGRLMVEALPQAAARMGKREFTVRLDLRLGKSSAKVLTSDLSLDYVKINAEYTT